MVFKEQQFYAMEIYGLQITAGMNVVATDVCKYLPVVDPETGDKFPTITWGDQGNYNGDI